MNFTNLTLTSVTGVVRYSPKIRRWHSVNTTHIIGIKLSGAGSTHDFGYKKMSLDKDCVYFLNKDEPYYVDSAEPGEAFSVHFTSSEPIDTHSFCVKTENSGVIIRELEKIEALFLKGDCGNRLSMHFYRLCVLIDEIRSREYTPKNPSIYLCREYMDLHFREKDCLVKAAEQISVTRRRFNDIFRNTFDITPARYITAKRIDYAKSLLASAQLSVSEVAQMCGFSDVYYFSRAFKRETGGTPSAQCKMQIV